MLNFRPGQTLPVRKQENSTLILYVLTGCDEMKVNDETVSIKAGTVASIKGEDDFSISVVNEDMSLFVTLCPNSSNELYSKSLG